MEISDSGGYSLDQLLDWCTHDRLIDGYDRSEEGIVIFANGHRHEFDFQEAHLFLKGVFTSTQRGVDLDDRNLA